MSGRLGDMKYTWVCFLLVFELLVFYDSPLMSQGLWEKANGPPGGIIGSIAMDETGQYMVADTRIIISPDYSIIYYSSDGGLVWNKSSSPFGARVTDLEFVDDGSVIAAVYSKGVYRSTNNGIDWQYAGLTGEWIWSLGKDSSGTLFAGRDLVAKIFRSTDHGHSWEFNYQPPGSRVAELHTSKKAHHIFAGLSRAIYRSTNGGDTWEAADSGISSLDAFYCITSDTFGNIYATTYHGGEFYWSTDDGNYWVNTDTNEVLVNMGKGALIKAHDNLFCATWYGVIRSSDHGYNWEPKNEGVYIDWGTKLAYDSQQNIYLGTYGAGLFKSADQGENWLPSSSGLNSALLLDIAFDKDENLYTAAWNGGLHKSTDKGDSWEVIHNGLTNLNLQCLLYTQLGVLFAGTEKGLFRSYNHGESWERTTPVGHDELFEIYENSIGFLFAIDYGNGLWRSNDNGDNWVRVSNTFASQFVFGVAIDSSDHIYAGTRFGYLYKSTDHGNNWSLAMNGLTADKTIMTITVAPDDNIYTGTVEDGVFRSTDAGQSWEAVNNGITDKNIRFITSNHKNELFASVFYGGLYYSTDSANSWIDITGGLGRTEISSIVFDKEGYLYLATMESVFRSTDTVITSINTLDPLNNPSSFSLMQNYPNPFNPATTIAYYLPKTTTVTLKVYDLLGREIKTLVNEKQSIGFKTAVWDGRNNSGVEVASGIYIYQLQLEHNHRMAKKMILLR